MWLSQTNEDSQRTPNHQSPPSDWAKTSIRLRGCFPKKLRLRRRLEFRKIRKEGLLVHGNFLNFQITSENLSYPRLGVTVSKQFGSAVKRNLLKRRIREVFRLMKSYLPAGLTIHATPKPSIAMPTLKGIAADFAFLIDYVYAQ